MSWEIDFTIDIGLTGSINYRCSEFRGRGPATHGFAPDQYDQPDRARGRRAFDAVRAAKALVVACVFGFAATAPGSVDAYEFTVHFTLTMWLAGLAGFSEADPYEIAKYDQATDDDPETQPLHDARSASDPTGKTRRQKYHFVDSTQLAELTKKASECSPTNIPHKAIGQYLHAFEDSYSHRSHGPKLGHAVAGHSPDKPWSKPAEFIAMLEDKLNVLVALRERCSPEPTVKFGPRVRPSLPADAMKRLTEWRREEQATGTLGDDRTPFRFERAVTDIVGQKADVYIRRYQNWRDSNGWRVP